MTLCKCRCKKKNVPWTVNVKLWAQFMIVMPLHQSHTKSTLGWQKENGRKGISHSTTNSIHMRWNLSYVLYLKETLNVTPNLVSSQVHDTSFKHLKRVSLVFVWKIGYYHLTYLRQLKLLNKQSGLFCFMRLSTFWKTLELKGY